MKAACENGAFSDTTLACTSGFTLANFTYDALSRRTKIDYAPSTGGAHVTYAYTDADDLTALDHDMSGTGDDAQFDFTYTAAQSCRRFSVPSTGWRSINDSNLRYGTRI